MDEDFTFGNIEVNHKWLFLPSGARIKLSEITNMDIVWRPRRKLLVGIIIWFIIMYFYDVFKLDNYGVMLLIGLIILFGGPVLLYDSIKYNLTEAKTALHLQLSSGHNVFLHAKDRKFLEDMRDALWKSIASEKDVYTLTLNNYGTINVAQNIQNQNGKKK